MTREKIAEMVAALPDGLDADENELCCVHISLLREAVHVVPMNDLREHTASVACWCKPTEDDEWPDVWVHHSMDRREEYEGKETN